MKSIFSYSISTALIMTIVMLAGWGIFAPSLLHAQSDSDQVIVNLTVDSAITISSPADETMEPNIGVTNSTSTGTTTWTVTTNDSAGYTLAVSASTSPAMQSGGDSFADYTEAVAGTPEAWSVASGNFEFGYSAFGTDVNGEYGAGTSCVGTGGSGNIPADKNYEGFAVATNVIASSTSVTAFGGNDATVCYAAEQNQVFAPSGSYSATITGTATVQ